MQKKEVAKTGNLFKGYRINMLRQGNLAGYRQQLQNR